jgi:hypothetical protein
MAYMWGDARTNLSDLNAMRAFMAPVNVNSYSNWDYDGAAALAG